MLNRIDEFLVNKVYQSIIDWSQKDSAWWVREMAFFGILYTIMRIVCHVLGFDFDTKSIVGMVIDILCCVMFYMWSFDRILMASIGSANWIRKIFMIAIPIFAMIDLKSVPFNIPMDVIILSSYFFAACRPPTPRKKTQSKLALQ
jgi:hypothetical protein